MSKQQFKGRTAAEAAIKACEALGVTRSELKYSLVSDSGEAMARLVVIEAEASAQSPRAPAPPPMAPVGHRNDVGDDSPGKSGYGYGSPAPAREHRALRHDRGQISGRSAPAGGPGRGEAPQGGRAHSEGEVQAAPAAETARAPHAERPERALRGAGGRSGERAEPAPRGGAEATDRSRRGEGVGGRRRGGEGRTPSGRGRHDGQERGSQDGIDSLLRIEPTTAPVARHPSIDPTSPRARRSLSVPHGHGRRCCVGQRK